MQPTIKNFEERTLIGMWKSMSLSNNRTYELFSDFMPRRKEITDLKDERNFDIRIYPEGYFGDFSPSRDFVKWAGAEVAQVVEIPRDLEVFVLGAGSMLSFTIRDDLTIQPSFGTSLPNGYPHQAICLIIDLISISWVKERN